MMMITMITSRGSSLGQDCHDDDDDDDDDDDAPAKSHLQVKIVMMMMLPAIHDDYDILKMGSSLLIAILTIT